MREGLGRLRATTRIDRARGGVEVSACWSAVEENGCVFLSFCAARALTVAVATAQAQSLAGTGCATVNRNLPSGIMITSSFISDGHLQSTTQNHMGQSFMPAKVSLLY